MLYRSKQELYPCRRWLMFREWLITEEGCRGQWCHCCELWVVQALFCPLVLQGGHTGTAQPGGSRAAPRLAGCLCCQRVLTLGLCSIVTEFYLVREQESLTHLLCGQKAKRLITLMSNTEAFPGRSREDSFGADTGILLHRYYTLLSGGTTIHITGSYKFFYFVFFPSLK